ncbi:hypothetical protein G4177_29470 [Corallococcus sp. ZKHCc1 1396]|uniref:Uncharacterized protein n=2 Tax=Corallococcus soli TaxID=2710757 RepID=A0ABR9PWJ7_9BACT|nr:hypothetical protein [Corallococcus soli]MBE4752303.1 hypothetical protein [Corallococcus soli]
MERRGKRPAWDWSVRALLLGSLLGAPVALAAEARLAQVETPASSMGPPTFAPHPPEAPSTQAGSSAGPPTSEPRSPEAPTTQEGPPASPMESPASTVQPPPLESIPSDVPRLDTATPPPAAPPRVLRPFIPHGEPDTDARLSGATLAAHGGVTLLPLASVWVATRVGGDSRLGATAAEAAAGTLAASIPGRFLFVHPSYPQGRWQELEVGAFGAAMVVTPPIAALGTWGMGEVAFGDSENRGHAYLGALGGATAGMLLGIAAHEGLKHLAGDSERLATLRRYLAFSLIGTGATVGYQWSRTPTQRR